MEDFDVLDFYEDLVKKYSDYFCIDYLKEHTFDEVILNLFCTATVQHTIAAIYFQLIVDVTDNMKNTSEIFNGYSKNERENLETFRKRFEPVLKNTNKTLRSITKLSEFVSAFRNKDRILTYGVRISPKI